jgi:caffeoyl-CoA O-methyltransferase
MSSVTTNLTPALYAYLQQYSLREPAVLKKLREKTHLLSMSNMQICPEQGQFMRLLIELIGAKKTLDIGTFTGYSALAVALSLPEDGQVVACDLNVEWTNIAKQFWQEAKVAHKIKLYLAPALNTLQQLIDHHQAGTFDFAFIDADKINYLPYYENSLILLRQGGLIAIDNVLWDGKVADPTIHDPDTQAIRAVNTFLLTDERVNISMLPIGDGLTLAIKR